MYLSLNESVALHRHRQAQDVQKYKYLVSFIDTSLPYYLFYVCNNRSDVDAWPQ